MLHYLPSINKGQATVLRNTFCSYISKTGQNVLLVSLAILVYISLVVVLSQPILQHITLFLPMSAKAFPFGFQAISCAS